MITEDKHEAIVFPQCLSSILTLLIFTSYQHTSVLHLKCVQDRASLRQKIIMKICLSAQRYLSIKFLGYNERAFTLPHDLHFHTFFNPLTAKLFNLNFHPPEIVSR